MSIKKSANGFNTLSQIDFTTLNTAKTASTNIVPKNLAIGIKIVIYTSAKKLNKGLNTSFHNLCNSPIISFSIPVIIFLNSSLVFHK